MCLFTAQCIAPLGMESGLIPDRDISASSCYNDGNVAPQNGRFVYALSLFSNNLLDYIDLNRLVGTCFMFYKLLIEHYFKLRSKSNICKSSIRK